jgi:hypothetical protein
MRNFIVRFRALIIAVLPFIIAGIFWFLIETARGFEGVGYLLLAIAVAPILAGMSVMSVVFAFQKEPDNRLRKTTKVVSIASATVCVGVVLIGLFGLVTSTM